MISLRENDDMSAQSLPKAIIVCESNHRLAEPIIVRLSLIAVAAGDYAPTGILICSLVEYRIVKILCAG